MECVGSAHNTLIYPRAMPSHMASTQAAPPMPVPYYPIPPKDNASKLVLLVVAIVVIVVVVTIVMAAVLYVMMSGLLAGPGPGGAPITFGPPSPCGTGCTEIVVTGTQSPALLSSYTVTFTVGGSTQVTTALQAGVLHDANGVTLTFSDGDGDGRLSDGDAFRVQNAGASTQCDLALAFASGSTGVGWGC